MIEQQVTIQKSEDPFDTEVITVKLPKGVKLMSTEPYAPEMLDMYGVVSDYEKDIYTHESIDHLTKGEITHIMKNPDGTLREALVDIGSKYTAYINLGKEPQEIIDALKVGLNIDIKVKPKKNGEVSASISEAFEECKRREILEAINNKSLAFTATVKELIHGGYWVEVSGIQTFMPGSLAGMNKLHNFESLVGQQIIVMPITYSKEKETIVVSCREYLQTKIPQAIEDLRGNLKEKITGFVTGTTAFGVFAEFNECLTGLIPKAELVDSKEEFDKRDIKPGDELNFWVKEIINQKKIILTQTGAPIDPWDIAVEKYPPFSEVKGKITKITNYGAFVQLEKGISGLIHKTQLKGVEISKGDIISVRIKGVNAVEKKVSMALA
jgi:ribosomal protein S1|tara:strand:- start:530 stop:1675 length:1146 start_codon:yes stop_codon:yes gene_type:complete